MRRWFDFSRKMTNVKEVERDPASRNSRRRSVFDHGGVDPDRVRLVFVRSSATRRAS